MLGALALLSAGCSPTEEIHGYTAARDKSADNRGALPAPVPLPPEPVSPPSSPTVSGEDRSRTLGVIIPTGPEAARYIKFSGAIAAVTAAEAKYNEFVTSVRLKSANATPEYTVPAGWRENPPRQFVANSFTVGLEGTPQVTLSDKVNGTLLANVNRWRAEVGLPDVTEADLPKSITETTLGATKAYRVDFRGPAAPAPPGGSRMRGLPGTK